MRDAPRDEERRGRAHHLRLAADLERPLPAEDDEDLVERLVRVDGDGVARREAVGDEGRGRARPLDAQALSGREEGREVEEFDRVPRGTIAARS